MYFGGLIYPWTYDTTLDQVNVSVTHFADDFLAFLQGARAER